MSLQIGQYGSQLRRDYVQPPVTPASGGIISMGAYLEPDSPVTSLAIEDPSRFRPGTFVAPTAIELMHGFLDYQFYDTNPQQSDTRMFAQTYTNQRPAAAPRGYSYSSARAAPGSYVNLEPYGLATGGPVSPVNCPVNQGAYYTVTGGCALSPQSPLYNPRSTNTFF